VNGSFTGTALLTPQGAPNRYVAQIPYLGSGVNVTYYIKAVNANVSRRLPLDAPTGYFSYMVGTDNTGPTIDHTPLGNQSISSWPPRISATIKDLVGVGNVQVEYFQNSNPLTSFTLSSVDSVYSDTLHLERVQVSPGDTIAYRIVATDNAHQPNTTTYPPSGYISFAIKNYDNLNVPFENTSGGFTGTNDWAWGTPSLPSPSAHGGAKCWATSLNGNYTVGPRLSSLTTATYTVFSDRASFSFWHWYEMQGRFDGANVKVSVNGDAFQVIQPTDSFPEPAIYSGFGNPLGGQPGYSSTEGTTWSKATFDLTGIASEGNTIAVRFDFGADNSIQYRGWYIDDFTSDGLGTLIVTGAGQSGESPLTFSLAQNYPNPFNPTTTISYTVASPSVVSLKIFDVLGREVATVVNKAMPSGRYEATWDASGVASGLYFYRLDAGSFVEVKKMMLLR
jgi:Secretion system C-terminal sorting domain/Immune inhibitor A-like, MAM domain